MAARGVRYPAPTRRDHEQFCLTEGWERRKSATSRRGTHHVNFELALADGRILFTRVSHPVDRTGYGASMWSHILRDQLDVNPGEFWACVQDGVSPDRGDRDTSLAEATPLEVVTILVQRMRVPQTEVRAMTKDQAIARMVEGFSKPLE